MADERRCFAYLVRLWTVHSNGDLVWRASVENAHTGERRAFADVDGRLDFLQAAVTADAATPGQMEGGSEERLSGQGDRW